MVEKMPTLEELNHLYESEQYKNLLKEFAYRLNIEIECREDDKHNLFFKLLHCQRCYMALNEDLASILEVVENNRERFIEHQVAVTKHFNEQDIDSTYLIEKFCEFYLLQTGNIKRLYSYLNVAQSHAPNDKNTSNIPKIYKEAITDLFHISNKARNA